MLMSGGRRTGSKGECKGRDARNETGQARQGTARERARQQKGLRGERARAEGAARRRRPKHRTASGQGETGWR
jgi:hypothetical protein